MKFHASFVPAGMPAPQSPAAVPALAHTSVPPGLTVQPLAFRMLTAAETLNGYGSVAALDGRYGLCGSAGMGPYAGAPAPCMNAVIQPCWSTRCASACRMYSWAMMLLKSPVVSL